MSILLDLVCFYPSYFFINVINSKKLYIVLIYGLIIDFIISYTNGIITIILSLLFIIRKMIKRYYLSNIICILLFLIIYQFFSPLSLKESIISFSLYLIFIFLNNKHKLKWW